MIVTCENGPVFAINGAGGNVVPITIGPAPAALKDQL